MLDSGKNFTDTLRKFNVEKEKLIQEVNKERQELAKERAEEQKLEREIPALKQELTAAEAKLQKVREEEHVLTNQVGIQDRHLKDLEREIGDTRTGGHR